MERIFSGKTLDAAKREAIAAFAKDGVEEYDVEFEIIEQPVKKLFITKGEFRIKSFASEKNADVMSLDNIIVNTDIVLKQRTEVPEQDFSSYSEVPEVSDSDYATGTPRSTTRRAEPARPRDMRPAPRAGYDSRVVSNTGVGHSASTTPIPSNRRYESRPLKTQTTEFPKDKVLAYVDMLIRGVGGTSYDVAYTQNGGDVRINITGDKVGGIIGRHGDVLESIQCLASLMKNRCGGEGYKLAIDCNNYRNKRRLSLEQIADRTSEKVLRYGKRITLEPMSSYERRIIHSRVAYIAGVSSSSFGSEPYRKVVIAPKNTDTAKSTAAGDNGSNNSIQHDNPVQA